MNNDLLLFRCWNYACTFVNVRFVDTVKTVLETIGCSVNLIIENSCYGFQHTLSHAPPKENTIIMLWPQSIYVNGKWNV